MISCQNNVQSHHNKFMLLCCNVLKQNHETETINATDTKCSGSGRACKTSTWMFHLNEIVISIFYTILVWCQVITFHTCFNTFYCMLVTQTSNLMDLFYYFYHSFKVVCQCLLIRNLNNTISNYFCQKTISLWTVFQKSYIFLQMFYVSLPPLCHHHMCYLFNSLSRFSGFD